MTEPTNSMSPFSLKNMPFEFSSIMSQLLGELPFVKYLCFMDDITFHDSDLEIHIDHTIDVVDRLHRMKINLNKCVFKTDSLNILDHIIKNGSIKMDELKITAEAKRIAPKNNK